MTELQQNRYDQLIRRIGGLIGAKSMVNDVLTELFPMINVEDLRAELSLPGGTRLGLASVRHVASAADRNHAQLFNPVDSNMLVVLERVDVHVDPSQRVEYIITDVELADLDANHSFRDTREGIPPQPLAQARNEQQVGGLPEFGQFMAFSDSNFLLEEKRGLFVLAPGTGVTFATTALNSTSIFSFMWRERVAEKSELNFP